MFSQELQILCFVPAFDFYYASERLVFSAVNLNHFNAGDCGRGVIVELVDRNQIAIGIKELPDIRKGELCYLG